MCAHARGEGGRCARPPSVTVWPSVAGARPGPAKVGRGARGAASDGGAADGDGARTPLGGDESRRAPSTGANPGGGGGSATPSPRGRTGPGRAPPEGHRGGGRGWAPGLRGPGPGSAWAGAGETGRALGLQLGGGGAGGLCWLGANPERPPGAGRGPPRAAAPWGGAGCSLPGGRRGPLLSEGGGGRVSPGSWPRGMGPYPQPSTPESLFGGVGGGGGGGGGGWRLLCAPTHAGGGGVAGGSSVRLGRKNPVASPGLVGPFEEEPRIRRGGLRYRGWYGMVWYGMVWYGMVWYGMVCCCCCCEGTQHVPAGEIARHALPGQGAREQSARVTLAGRVPTTTEGGGGGGGRRGVEGGGGARGGGWGHLWKLPWSPPPSRGGRVTRPVRSGCCGGGGRGGDLGVGKARPGPRTLHALPEHPAEVAVPRVRPWRGLGRWPVLLAVYGGEGRPGSCCLPAPSHLCLCCGVAAMSPVVRRARARRSWGEGGDKGGSTRARSWVYSCRRVVFGSGAVPRCLSLCPAYGRPRGTTGGGSRPGPGAWVAAGGRGGRGAMQVRGPWRSRGVAGGPAGGRQWP